MKFYMAFDKDEDLEFMLYHSMKHKQDGTVSSDILFKRQIGHIGLFLIQFLNTDFTDIEKCRLFISQYCFETLYDVKYPEKKLLYNPTEDIIRLKLSSKDFLQELYSLSKHYQDLFLYIKNTILKEFELPYDVSIDEYPEENIELSEEIKKTHIDLMNYMTEIRGKSASLIEKFKKENPNEFEQYLQDQKQLKEKNRDKHFLNNDSNINTLISELSLDFTFIAYLGSSFDIYAYNVPYCFTSPDIISILGISVKEFKTRKNATIRQCQNCSKYFIPENLKSTKYCNYIFKDNKTCKEIGKNIAYKKSLKKDVLLEKYRRRYMSLASNVSHYGKKSAIVKFENYKKEGSIMKENYLNKKITAKQFEKWIESTKK